MRTPPKDTERAPDPRPADSRSTDDNTMYNRARHHKGFKCETHKKPDKLYNTKGENWIDFVNNRYELELEEGVRSVSPLREDADNPSSFVTNEDSWHDFAAPTPETAHGDVYSFIMIKENCSFTEAYKIFNGENFKATDPDFQNMKHLFEQKDAFSKTLSNIVQYCIASLKSNTEVVAYLNKRGFTNETIAELKIGYLDSIPCLEEYLRKMGLDLASADIYMDNMVDMIIIPFLGMGDAPTYLTARKLDDDEGPKYVKLRRKGMEEIISNPIYGMQTRNRKVIKRVILCEGVLDAMTLIQLGDVAFASCGGQYSREHVKTLVAVLNWISEKNPDLDIVIWFDFDPDSETGQKSTLGLAETLMEKGIVCKIVRPSEDMIKNKVKVDINSMFVDQGKARVLETMDKATPYIDFRLAEICAIADPVKQHDAMLEFMRKLRKSGFREDHLTLLLEKNGLKGKAASSMIKSTAPTPQSVAAGMAASGDYVYSNGLYSRDVQLFKISDAVESATNIRRQMERACGHGNITIKMLNECRDALNHKVNIGSDTHACIIDFGTGGWIRAAVLKDPVLMFQNCTVILGENGPEIIEAPRDIFSKLSFDYSYIPGAVPTAFLEALSEYLPDPAHRQIVQEYAGYLFFPDHIQIQAFIVFIGPGNNGKGTVIRAIRSFMGSNLCGAFNLGRFLETHSLSALVGKRIVSISEIDRHEETSVAAIKEWTGGDTVFINPKNEKPFDYQPEGKLMISTNVRPYLPDPSNGIFRRIIPLEFRYIIEKSDGRMEDAIMKEKAGLMNWAIQGYYNLQGNGSWTHRLPEDCQKLREEICQGSDPFRQWAAEHLVQNAEGVCYVNTAFRNYLKWADDCRIKHTMSKHSFATRLRSQTGGSEPVHGVCRYYQGWELVPNTVS